MKCIKPNPLKRGDQVAIVAVSRNVDYKSIEAAMVILEAWGLKVKLADNLQSASHPIFAGSDQERLEGVQGMINDKNVKAIFFSRGGYGATRIIDQIDFQPLAAYPKWFIGFSDISVLLNHAVKLNVESIHALMAFQFQNKNYRSSLDSLKKLLFEEKYAITAPPNKLNITGSAKASIIGGNLTMFTNLLGTASDMDTTGKILLLEDVEEYVYKIDRMMVHLKRAGKLKHLAGAIIGHMTNMLDNDIPFGKSAHEVIHEHLLPLNIPVCFGFPTGHEPDNLAVPFGREASFNVTANGTFLEFEN